MPLISVVIRHQGDNNKLQDVMQTLESQSTEAIEIIILNQSPVDNDFLKKTLKTSYPTVFCNETNIETLKAVIRGEYFVLVDSQDSLFEGTLDKMYHALAFSGADALVGTYVDLIEGQFYFYPWGDDWLAKTLTNRQGLQMIDHADAQIRKAFQSFHGKLFKTSLLSHTTENFPLEQLAWRLYLEAESLVYINHPTYIYTPRLERPLKETYRETLRDFEERIKACSLLEGYPLEETKRHYMQELANLSQWLMDAGATKESEIPYNKLIVAEKGIFPFLDLPSLDFTIISNNCVGGLIYKQFGLPYRTPFVGLFILPEDYYKLTKNFRYYMEQDIVFDEELLAPAWTHEVYPLGHLGDIEIHFLHYDSVEEARSKWNRRKARMNWDNLYFKFDNKDAASEEVLEKMDQLPYQNKLILVHRPYEHLKNQYVIPNQDHLSEVAVINDPMNTFDVVSWLKKGGNKL